jgi:hypothetical protein
MIRLATFWAFVLAIGALGQAQQSFLLIPDWTNDRVCAFSPVDGSLINANFIPTNTTLFDSPKHALPTPLGTILVSDQLKDAIHEFDGFGNYIRTIANITNNGIDNLRGMAIRAGKLYVTVGLGTYENTIQRFNLDGTGQETFIGANLDSPFAIYFRENDMLISNSRNPALIRQFDLNGAFLGQWGGTTIRFPQQITRRRSNGNLLVAGFSPPAGIYEFDAAGNQVAYYAVSSGPRGAYELENGLIHVHGQRRREGVRPQRSQSRQHGADHLQPRQLPIHRTLRDTTWRCEPQPLRGRQRPAACIVRLRADGFGLARRPER